MSVVINRIKLVKTLDMLREKKVSMAVFATSSHWNTEAILLAASKFAKKYEIQYIPVAVAITYNYGHMPQAIRVTYEGNPRHGFLSIMEHLKILCNSSDSPYSNVTVFPHLDHGDPFRDKWALTEGLPYLSSVMFDAQKYPFEENIEMTKDYVKKYGCNIIVEGIMDELAVEGSSKGTGDDTFAEKAFDFISRTGVDLLVANLGTEQQSTSAGNCTYLSERAKNITEKVGKAVLVLHGTSCLLEDQLGDVVKDGVIRLNIWSKIARQAGQYAARKIVERIRKIEEGDFESTESRQYIFDSIINAEETMENMLGAIGYQRLAGISIG